MKLLVLDGNSIVNRAFYGIKLLTTHDGSYTNAIYGFLNILAKLLADETPDEVAIAFDLKAPTFRHKMYDQYKGTRKGMPQELADQLPELKELLAALGFVMVSREGWEADDILGTLAAACTARGDECRIATGDRDSLQLAAPGVAILLASTKMGRSETVVMDEAAVREKYGVEPKQLIEVKALMGDTSDNIPGVAGIGEKTALALISAFGSLDGVYANLEDSRIKPGQRKKLAEHEAEARMSRTLAEIDCHAPIETAPGTYKRSEGDPAAAAAILNRLEMPSMLEKFGVKAAAAAPAADLPQRPAQPMEGHQPAGDCLVLPAAGQNWLVVDAEGVWLPDTPQLAALLARQDIALRVFDAKPLYKLALEQGSRCRNITFDAKLAAYLLNPLASGYTVERLAGEYQIQPAFLCPDQPDAGVAAGLFDALDTGCKEAGMDKLLGEMELPLAGVLAGMEEDGILVDKEGLAAFGEQLRDRLGQLLAEIYNQVGYEFNLNSPKQLGEALFGKLGLPPRKKTKSGYSTDADTLESLRAYHPVIDNILEYRIYQKLNSTYAEGLLKVIGPDGRIHSTFSQTETRTGRISSNEPNLQNIPIRTELGSRLRQYFVARPGWVFLDADYSQIELRIMAHISGDEAMREAFRQGADIHRATASRLYQLPPEEVTPRMRSSVKAVNFGILYGKGAFSLSRDLGVSVKEADDFIKAYLGAYPKVKEYMDNIVAEGMEKGYVTTLYGRRRMLPELSSSNRNLRAQGERMALNTPIQGTAADIIKLAMVRVANRLEKEGLAARLILQVHDELIVECPESEAELAARLLKEEMEGAASLSVPLTADVNQGKNWLEAH
ncbi:MAG TPA: DNA polymerase I [Candidatus Anaerofilum excrementigallinarum]|nr:DNA polymerase I [Candidatus Anaerofilum excrementigallinarum]